MARVRAAAAAVVALAALAGPADASAYIIASFSGGKLTVSSDADDAIALSCGVAFGADYVMVNQLLYPRTGAVLCNAVTSVEITGGPGKNAIDLTHASPLDFPNVTSVVAAGGGGDDRIDAGPLREVIIGGAGADRIVGDTSSDDRYDGGPDTDEYMLYAMGAATRTVTVQDGGATAPGVEDAVFVHGTAYPDAINLTDSLITSGSESFAISGIEKAWVFGRDGADVLDGSAVSNLSLVLWGQQGDDTLIGGANDDSLSPGFGRDDSRGGGGNDSYTLRDLGPSLLDEFVTDTSGVDQLWFFGAPEAITLDLALSAGQPQTIDLSGHTLAITGTIENLFGSEYDDTLSGNGVANRIDGMLGADELDGRGGDDVIFGSDGDDRLRSDDGGDRLLGGNGSDEYRVSFGTIAQTTATDLGTAALQTDSLRVFGTGGADALRVADGLIRRGVSESVTFNGMESVSIDAGAGADTIDVDSLGAAGVTIDGGADDDAYTIAWGGLLGSATLADTGASGTDLFGFKCAPGISITPTQVTNGSETVVYSGMETLTTCAPPPSTSLTARPASFAPVLDGVVGAKEWAAADSTQFTIQGVSGTIYTMHYGKTLYIAAVFDDPTVGLNSVSVVFDNDDDGVTAPDDDLLVANLGNDFGGDVYFDGLHWRLDVDGGGSDDLDSYAVHDGARASFELRHPLCSGDARDFCAKFAGQVLGFNVFYQSGDGSFSGGWPSAHLSGAASFGDLTIG